VCFNAPAADLDLTFRSLHSQTLKNWEHIIIDGASTKAIIDLIQMHAPLIDILVSEPDHGIYDAMNKGIPYCRGKFVYFLNMGDSFKNENVLQMVKDTLTSNQEVDALYCNVDYSPGGISNYPPKLTTFWLCNEGISHQGLFARKILFDKVGVFDSAIPISGDNDWIIRILKHGAKFKRLTEVLTNMPQLGASSNREAAREGKEQLKSKHYNSIDKAIHYPRLILYKFMNRLRTRQFHIPPFIGQVRSKFR
jgi:glycosyltransferase involved in cell wall biosynthesis